MDPFELFQNPLTYPRHERGDIHYIGEALPAPSLVTSTLSTGTPAYVGGSSVPAREDHVHALDLADLIAAIEADPEWPGGDVDLSDYYTKTEIDAFLDAINTALTNLGNDISDLASILASNYYTIAEVDALLGSGGGPGDHIWSYTDQVVDPATTVFSDRWYPPGNIEIFQLWAAVNVPTGAGSSNYIITLWKDGSNVGSVTLLGTNNTIASGTLTIAGGSVNRFQISVAKSGAFTGDAEDLVVGIKYNHA